MSDESEERAIRKVIADWMEATKRGDTPAILALMTADVVFLVPGRDAFGREVFEQASTAQSGASFEGESRIAELRLLGDHAYVRSDLTVRATMPGGEVVVREGPVLSIFRKEGEQWKLARDANMLTVRTPG